MSNPAHTTRLLQLAGAGDADAAARLLPLIQDELHRIAQRLMVGERDDHTLQPTALMNEAWLRLIDGSTRDFEGRAHFMRVAARSMRNVLVDHARARRSTKRGGDRARVTLDARVVDGLVVSDGPGSLDVLTVDEALTRLAELDPQLVQIVELKFFGGLTDAEIAAATDTPLRSVQRGWRTARAWLAQHMGGEEDA